MYNNKRRAFIKKGMLGAACAVTGTGFSTTPSSRPNEIAENEQLDPPQSVLLGKNVKIDLLISENRFLGIGSVAVNNVRLRGALPMMCEIRNPDGISVTDYLVKTKKITDHGISCEFDVRTKKSGMMEWMLHTVRNRENLYGWTQVPKPDKATTVRLEILPLQYNLGGYLFTGFSYQYFFDSKTFPVYKITDRATWEISGNCIGSESWMRVGHLPSIVPMNSQEQVYSTENYYHGIANPNLFQFLPLQTELQGFTFQAHDKGILVTRAAEVSHVRTLLEKPGGSDNLFHYHQHCNDLSLQFQTSPMEVLFLDLPHSDQVTRFNVFESVRAATHQQLHKLAGIRQERVSSYGQIEQWDEPDFDDYTQRILPEFIKKKIKWIFIPSQFQNAMNVWGVSNMCCNVDYKFSSPDALHKLENFCSQAEKSGIQVMMWGNTAISTLTEMFQYKDGRKKGIDFLPQEDSIAEVISRAKDPFVRNPSNAIEADHYTPRFAALNLRDPDIRAYWKKRWKEAHSAGIRAIFLDSSFNMSSDKFHFVQNPGKADKSNEQDFYRPVHEPAKAVYTQFHAHLDLVREMQAMGYTYCGEDLGVFGIHRHGPDLAMMIGTMPLWPECIINFDEKMVVAKGADPFDVFFRGLAYRVMWNMQWDFKQNKIDCGISDPRVDALLSVFDQVNELMELRTIAPDGVAVTYVSSGSSLKVWWVLKQHAVRLEHRSLVTNVSTGEKTTGDFFNAEPLTVYTTLTV